MTTRPLFAALLLLPFAAAGLALADEAAAPSAAHTMLTPDQIKWGEGPPSLPPGAKMAVLYGDPSKPAMFIMRAKLPAGYKIPAHWHPTDENITVLSGVFLMGMADKLDATKAKTYPSGSFINMPAKTHHFAMTGAETVIEIASMGPFEVNYINPAVDPRNAAAASTPASPKK
ncbi:MAG: Cupin region [Myxococcales bacterium]|nr:Cupin region [Myxococcales bacterium]